MTELPRTGDWSRRRFLARAAWAGAGLVGAAGVAHAAPRGTNPFTLGVASGDPTSSSVVLWTRLAPDPLNDGGMPPVPVLVRWRVAADHAVGQVVAQGLAIAWPAFGHAVHVTVSGLAPDRWYFYQFSAGGEESAIGRARTLPASSSSGALSFAFVSCQDWQGGFYSAYRNLAREDLDVVFHLGDAIYESGPQAGAPRQHVGGEPTTLAAYRNRHALYLTDPHYRAARAAFPFIVTPDDHEVDNNYAGVFSENRDALSAFLARRAAAYRAFYEHMPLRASAFPIGWGMRLYRGFSWGTLAQFSALDTRQYRSDQACNDVVGPRCLEALIPTRTMTGARQERWLLDRLDSSPARWNVIAQQVMFAQFDFLPDFDPDRQDRLYNLDQWDGYPAARSRITEFLQQRQPANPIVISGDIHASFVNNLLANYDQPGSAVVGAEYVGPSITSGFPPEYVPFVQAALADNPHILFFEGRLHGYVRCRVTRDLFRADYRLVPTILDEDVDAHTFASFVSVDGVPGAMPA